MDDRTPEQRLQDYATEFRSFSSMNATQVGFEDADQWDKLPPSERMIKLAGGTVRRILRLGGFKDDAGQLIQKWERAGNIGIWKELVTNLRTRANVRLTFDHIKTFDEDCQLVADALENDIRERQERSSQKNTPKRSRGREPLSPAEYAFREDYYLAWEEYKSLPGNRDKSAKRLGQEFREQNDITPDRFKTIRNFPSLKKPNN